MDNITVRKAHREDCPRLMELVRGLAEYERAPEEVTICESEFEESGFGPHRVWEALVAESEGQVIGFALWYVRFSTWKGRRLYLEDLYVEPRYRRSGVGRRLFDALMEEARRRGFGGMAWQALDWNEPALKFYESYGARLDGQWVNCSLEL